MPRVTIKTIAEHAGLARSTVSEILNGKSNYCSRKKRALVMEIADKLGYVPNVGFKIMTGRNTNTVALLFSQERTYHEEYNLRLAMLLLNRLQQQGHSAYTVTMSQEEEANLRRIRELISRGCREFIFLGSPVGVRKLYGELRAEKLDWVSFNGFYEKDGGVNFRIDYENLYRAYIRNFRNRGLDSVCVMAAHYFASHCRGAFAAEGLEGKWRLLEIPSVESLQADCAEQSFHIVRDAVGAGLKDFPAKCGWICASDHEALGAIAALRAADRPVADENGSLVCGFGNTRLSQFSPLPVSSADFELNNAADLLMKNLHADVSAEYTLKHQIIFR